MNSGNDNDIRISLAWPMAVRGRWSWFKEYCRKGGLFTKHLMEHILQSSYLVGSKHGYTLLQPSLVNSANLVGSHIAFAPHNVTSHSIGIAMYGRCDGNNNHCVKMFVSSSGLTMTHGRTFCISAPTVGFKSTQ